MAHPAYIREKAIQLRTERKLTIDEIAERLALPKTTIFYWVKDIPIPRKGGGGGFLAEAQRRGTEAMQEKYRRIREQAYADGAESYPALCREPNFKDFVCIYIAEGYKKSRNEVGICNSDPAVVKLANEWISRFSRNPVKYSIQYHADQSLSELRAYWSELLGIRPDEIRMQRKSNSGKLSGRNWRSQFGVLNVVAADTRFRAELQAWVDLIKAEWK